LFEKSIHAAHGFAVGSRVLRIYFQPFLNLFFGGGMKKLLRSLLCAVLLPMFVLLPNAQATPATQAQRFTGHFFDTFDTVVTLIGYAPQATFDNAFKAVQDRFVYLHRLFDKYNAYEGVTNLYTINQEAAKGPVKVAPEIMELLVRCRELQKQFPGATDIAMGSVLNIWHDHREAAEADPQSATVPAMEELQKAAAHMNMDNVVLDTENSTVLFTDPEMSLDVGAVAKGYAAESAAQLLLNSPMPSFILNAGGNVRSGQPPQDGRSAWGVGIQDPFAQSFSDAPTIETLFLSGKSVVTSGINERYFEVDGVRYHHLIDPDTLQPGRYMASVTIVTEDSFLADFLSTTLFLTPYEEGRALIDSLPDVEALWVLLDGTIHMSDGLLPVAKSQGATAE
jgi:thiamine biosynthesis lipoprotein